MKEALKMGYVAEESHQRNRATKIQSLKSDKRGFPYRRSRIVQIWQSVTVKFLVSLLLGATCLAAAMFTVVVDPIRLIVVYAARVDYGTFVHEAMSKEADNVHLSVYLFNITNAEKFIRGEDSKLKVEEVGPFTYQENRTNDDLEIDKVAGVMRYSPRHRATFLPEESVGRPEDMILTMPNIAMLSTASALSNYGYFAKMGFNMLASRLGSNATVQMSAYDYLWGYNEPLISLGNNILPGWIHFDTLGLLDRLYDEKAPFRVEVSAKDEDKFMIKSVNGIGGLPSWGYPETSTSCNSFNDSFEGIVYPPEMSPDRPLKLYRNVFCRFMELEYVGQRTMDFGVEGMAYKFSNRSFSKIPENECLCSKGVCHDGISDLSPCFYGLPVVLSNAHFLDTNPLLYERVEGMTPNEEQHGSDFIIEPIIGSVMMTKFSVQVNVMVRDVNFNSKISRFSDMFVPVGYFKIVQPRMQDDQIYNLRFIHVYAPYILLGVQLVLLVAGLLLLVHSATLFYNHMICARRKDIAFDTEKIKVKEILSTQPLMYVTASAMAER